MRVPLVRAGLLYDNLTEIKVSDSVNVIGRNAVIFLTASLPRVAPRERYLSQDGQHTTVTLQPTPCFLG